MIELCDTHAHLDSDQLHHDLDAVVDRARAGGVSTIIAVGITADSSARCIALMERYPGVHASVGIHPNEIPRAAVGDWDRIRALVTRPGVVGVGETGLDRYWDTTPFDVQEEWFARHLELSAQHDLPVIIHCREAEADVLRMLRQAYDRSGPIRGVMHSFCGSLETAEACLAMGLYVSFAGMLTYKTAQNVREVAARVPSDRLLVETDCPYLSPVPFRGKRNEPAHVAHTARQLAEVRGVTLEQLAPSLLANTRRLFGLTER